MSQATFLLTGGIEELAKKPHPRPFLLSHTLFFLPIFVAISAVILLVTYFIPKLYRYIKRSRDYEIIEDEEESTSPAAPSTMPSEGLVSDFTKHVRAFREYGTVLFAMEVIRTLCLAALLALSIVAAVQAEPSNNVSINKHKKHKHKQKPMPDYSALEIGEFGACSFYAYALIFSSLLLVLRPATPLRRHLIAHLDVLLLFAAAIYAHRDIYPLLTFNLDPADIDNAITWSRLALLGVVSLLIPFLRPRTYTPADPAHPSAQIHPEQTAPLLFYIFYEYMTPLVWKAWKSPALPYDDLHPLADYDHAELLYNKHMTRLDPLRRRAAGLKDRHLIIGIAATFKFEIFITCFMCFLAAFLEMAGPIGINRLLAYLEDGSTSTVRPIVWIALLFIGPTGATLAFQYYLFHTTRSLVRGEALLTQLLFDHALRLRMKDTVEAPATKSIPAEQAAEVEGDRSETEVGSEDPKEETEKPETKALGIAGKINVLIASDVESLIEGRDLPLVFVFAPIQLVLCIYYLWRILSWSSIVGMVTMLLTLPLPGVITKLATTYQTKRMLATDSRVDSITEAIGAIRIIKMFGWEDRIKEKVAAKREDELGLIWKRRLMSLANALLNEILPVLTMTVSFAMYTLVQKRELTASIVFTSMSVFELLKGQMGLVLYMVNNFITAYVSLQRLNKFLHESELIDEYNDPVAPIDSDEIKFHDATFSWDENFSLHIPDATFVKGKINLITGPTGSGKSSLLQALIGELHFERREGSYFNLPRAGGVSYAAQESWCMSESIKDNIIFGEPYEAERYKKVLHDCGLEPDLKLFDDGDETEVGEKGITLSGGQKARITLARAIYSKSDIILLDDVFSALDTLTSRFIIDNLFRGDLVKNRTILLITHHVTLVAPIAEYVISLNNGKVKHAGPIDATVLDELEEEEVDEKPVIVEEKKEEAKKPVAKLVTAEEKGEGRISRQALFSFFATFGGPIFWFLFFGLLLGGQLISAFETYWLGLWAKAYNEAKDWHQVSAPYYLGYYVALVLIGVVTNGISMTLYYFGATKASRVVHQRLVDHVFGAYMRFIDSTPVGRIISRFTKDMKAIDGAFIETFSQVASMSVGLIIKFLVVVTLVPLFSVPAIVIGALGGILGELYIHGQLSVKREMSNAKSPLFSHFSAAVTGIVSIRAYGAQNKLRVEARRRADKYTRAATAFYNLNRWVTVRIDMLGGIFAASLAAFLVYGPKLDASTTGFALTQAISFSGTILWWVRLVNDMEVQGNSVERIQDYLVIDQEPKSTPDRQPPAAWPTSGDIVLDKLSAKYSHDGPTVLDNLEVHIKSGEKVGIVGRTGSGKSTLALAILRMLPTTGSVIIDGVKTENINLHALRSNVTIIPQDPILLSGSMRFNLDPFGDHDDATLNDALQSSGLGFIRGASGSVTPQRLNLDTQIAGGGGNLSQGQRQLVALARALVRGSKVLILDEATASVDYETDQLIQESIRNLPSSCTVLTVAHRLNTVQDYDKILVLGAGKVLEYDSPTNLRNDKNSYYAKLVQAMEG